METELDALRRVNTELQAWVRDLLEENRRLRSQVAQRLDPGRPESPSAERPARPERRAYPASA
jgi:hypothetical protein